jgi:hypothetical protein
MDWCSVYLTPQGLPNYIYLSPPLIFQTTYNRIRTKNRPVWITPGAAPIRWMGPIRNPRWEQKRTEGYVIVSKILLLQPIGYTCKPGPQGSFAIAFLMLFLQKLLFLIFPIQHTGMLNLWHTQNVYNCIFPIPLILNWWLGYKIK